MLQYFPVVWTSTDLDLRAPGGTWRRRPVALTMDAARKKRERVQQVVTLHRSRPRRPATRLGAQVQAHTAARRLPVTPIRQRRNPISRPGSRATLSSLRRSRSQRSRVSGGSSRTRLAFRSSSITEAMNSCGVERPSTVGASSWGGTLLSGAKAFVSSNSLGALAQRPDTQESLLATKDHAFHDAEQVAEAEARVAQHVRLRASQNDSDRHFSLTDFGRGVTTGTGSASRRKFQQKASDFSQYNPDVGVCLWCLVGCLCGVAMMSTERCL